MSLPEQLFEPGDIVRLRTGKSPQRVVKIRWDQYRKIWQVFAYYLSSSREIERVQELTRTDEIPHAFLRRPRDQHDFVSWIPEESPFETAETQEKAMTDLYQVKGPAENPRFGTKLAENSQGEFVLEMKGEDGKVEAFHPSLIDLVVPYTIQLVSVPPSEAGIHLQCEPGKVKKDDILIATSNGKMFRVSAVDTKNRNPKSGSMTFFKLAGESVTIGSDN